MSKTAELNHSNRSRFVFDVLLLVLAPVLVLVYTHTRHAMSGGGEPPPPKAVGTIILSKSCITF